jgi:hypothetical protein
MQSDNLYIYDGLVITNMHEAAEMIQAYPKMVKLVDEWSVDAEEVLTKGKALGVKLRALVRKHNLVCAMHGNFRIYKDTGLHNIQLCRAIIEHYSKFEDNIHDQVLQATDKILKVPDHVKGAELHHLVIDDLDYWFDFERRRVYDRVDVKIMLASEVSCFKLIAEEESDKYDTIAKALITGIFNYRSR